MNLRTLKKLSKRAAPLLPLLGDPREQFAAEHARTGENYISTLVTDRKHWERSPCHPTHEPRNDYSGRRGMQLKHTTRAGRTMVIGPPSHPLKGTVMVGAVSGYYEPEWSEETAWEALSGLVYVEFTEWGDDYARPLRDFRTPGDIFAAANELIARAEAA